MKAKIISLWIVTLLMSIFLLGLLGGIVFAVLATIIAKYAVKGDSLIGVLRLVTAYAPCTDTTSVHTKAPNCLDENSGIIGFLRVKRGFNLSTITDSLTYNSAKTAKDIEVVGGLEAYWPAPSRVTTPGLSGRVERHNYWTFDLPFKHESVIANLNFWNTWTHSQSFGVVFITEDYKAFAPLDRDLEVILVDASAAPQGEQEFGKPLMFQGNVKWKGKDLPYYIDNLTKAMLQPDFQV